MIQQTLIKYPPVKSSIVQVLDNQYLFSLEPLLPGFGHTLGNSLRRVLLSSIPGFAVTRVKINDITHEYQAIDGVIEDAMNVILNIKQLRAKILTDDDYVILSLKKNKKGDVFAKDFATEKKAEIINSDLYICHLSKDSDLNIEIELRRGVGYLPVEKINFASNLNPQDILIDALFSPVINASLNVEKVRVGDRTDFDKLELSFKTDGTQNGEAIIEFAIDFVNNLFSQAKSALPTNDDAETSTVTKTKPNPSGDLELDEEILAILEKNGIFNKAELKKRQSELNDFAGMTKKRLQVINSYLKE